MQPRALKVGLFHLRAREECPFHPSILEVDPGQVGLAEIRAGQVSALKTGFVQVAQIRGASFIEFAYEGLFAPRVALGHQAKALFFRHRLASDIVLATAPIVECVFAGGIACGPVSRHFGEGGLDKIGGGGAQPGGGRQVGKWADNFCAFIPIRNRGTKWIHATVPPAPIQIAFLSHEIGLHKDISFGAEAEPVHRRAHQADGRGHCPQNQENQKRPDEAAVFGAGVLGLHVVAERGEAREHGGDGDGEHEADANRDPCDMGGHGAIPEERQKGRAGEPAEDEGGDRAGQKEGRAGDGDGLGARAFVWAQGAAAHERVVGDDPWVDGVGDGLGAVAGGELPQGAPEFLQKDVEIGVDDGDEPRACHEEGGGGDGDVDEGKLGRGRCREEVDVLDGGEGDGGEGGGGEEAEPGGAGGVGEGFDAVQLRLDLAGALALNVVERWVRHFKSLWDKRVAPGAEARKRETHTLTVF